MKTVKEISALSGVSIRTLRYYDEIGLLRPTAKSRAGYRLYDDAALDILQQILFFREFHIPLKEIKNLLESPRLDRERTLRLQRQMLCAKKARLERLIGSIDRILQGGQDRDFTVFRHSELEALWGSTAAHMPQAILECICQEFGGMEQWKQHYLQRTAQPDMQKGYEKVVQWYGSKDRALRAMTNPPSQAEGAAFAKRIQAIEKRLNEKRKCPADSLAVRELVGEYGSAVRQFYQVESEAPVMESIAASYRDARAAAAADAEYGDGAAAFFARAIEAFYGKAMSMAKF